MVADIVRRGRGANALRDDIPADILARLIEETARMVVRVDVVASPGAKPLRCLPPAPEIIQSSHAPEIDA